MSDDEGVARRVSPLAMGAEEFRAAGYALVDRVAGFLDSLPDRAVTSGASPVEVLVDVLPESPLDRRFMWGLSGSSAGFVESEPVDVVLPVEVVSAAGDRFTK